MEAYRNTNKLLSIKSIDLQGMVLEDVSLWGFLGITPPPSAWQVGDQIVIEKIEGGIKSDTMYRAVNKTRKDQDRPVLYLGGGSSKEQAIEMNKSWEDYPDNRLGKRLRIEKLLEDGCILLEDRSIWQLTNPTLQNEGEWEEGQYVRITKGPSKIANYHIENMDTGGTFFGTFMGFGR